MPISPHLLRKLQETLGAEAAEDLVSWMEDTDANRGDLAEWRHEMQLGFARIDARFAAMETLMEKRVGGIETLLEKRLSAVESKIGGVETLVEKRSADLIRWSFVFWVTAVGAIAALAGVLRQ